MPILYLFNALFLPPPFGFERFVIQGHESGRLQPVFKSGQDVVHCSLLDVHKRSNFREFEAIISSGTSVSLATSAKRLAKISALLFIGNQFYCYLCLCQSIMNDIPKDSGKGLSASGSAALGHVLYLDWRLKYNAGGFLFPSGQTDLSRTPEFTKSHSLYRN